MALVGNPNTPAAIIGEIIGNLAPNSNQAITATVLQQVLLDMTASSNTPTAFYNGASVATGLIATGLTQGAGLLLPAQINRVDIATGSAVVLPQTGPGITPTTTGVSGVSVAVWNNDPLNTLIVWPFLGETINGLGNSITQPPQSLYVYQSSDPGIWTYLSQENGSWIPYTPTLSTTSGTLTSATVAGRYQALGAKTIALRLNVQIATNGTGTGAVIVTLPFVAKNVFGGDSVNLAGRENTGGLALATVQTSAFNAIAITTTTNTYPGSNGASLTLAGIYEAA